MTIIETLNPFLEDYCDSNLTKKGSRNYYCPFCRSGTGVHKTPAFFLYNEEGGELRFNCFSCKTNGDIVDLHQKIRGIDNKTAIKELAEMYNINSTEATETKPTPAPEEAPQTDLTNFFLQANKHIADTDYHRGLSLNTLNHFKVGYDKCWKPQNKPTAPSTARLIIPQTKYSYLARATDEHTQIQKQQYGKKALFNAKALNPSTEPTFIVEGEIDAMSLYQVGGRAVAMSGTANIKLLVDEIIERKPTQPLILAMDNDEPGRRASEEIIACFTENGIDNYNTFVINDPYNDFNEMLVHDETNFKSELQSVILSIKSTCKEKSTELQNELKQTANEQVKEPIQDIIDIRTELKTKVNDIEKLNNSTQEVIRSADEITDNDIKNIETIGDYQVKYQKAYGINEHLNAMLDDITSQKYRKISTGIQPLDNALGGGLITGQLVVYGASTGTGKTTILTQTAENIAESGTPVLYVTLEMNTSEILAKCLSRQTEKDYINGKINADERLTVDDILFACKEKTQDRLKELMSRYGEAHKLLDIREYSDTNTTNEIRTAIKMQIIATGKTPVIFVDYLQLLQDNDPKTKEIRQRIDDITLDLKHIASEYNTPVVFISALNRSGANSESVNETAMKESGAIEYTGGNVITGQTEYELHPEYERYYKALETWEEHGKIADEYPKRPNKNAYPSKYLLDTHDRRKLKILTDENGDKWKIITLVGQKTRYGENKTENTVYFNGKFNFFADQKPEEVNENGEVEEYTMDE